MNRFLSLLLIPFFVLGQALPHSHAGGGVDEPDGHAVRPHVHLSALHSHGDHHHDGDHHHHDVNDDDQGDDFGNGLSSLPGDHDSDAIYLGKSTSTVSRSSTIAKLNLSYDRPIITGLADRQETRASPCELASQDRSVGLPIYLLVRSLRL